MLDEQGASDLLKPAPRPKQPPLLNYRAPEGVQRENPCYKGEFSTLPQVEMTKAQYKAIPSYSRWISRIGEHRVKTTNASRTPGWKEPKGDSTARTNAAHQSVCVFLTDSKEHPKPEEVEKPEPFVCDAPLIPHAYREPCKPDPKAGQMDAIRESLKSGAAVEVVSAPQLFVTPREIAEKMVDYADLRDGLCVLEPSAGTGNLIDVVLSRVHARQDAEDVAEDLQGDTEEYGIDAVYSVEDA